MSFGLYLGVITVYVCVMSAGSISVVQRVLTLTGAVFTGVAAAAEAFAVDLVAAEYDTPGTGVV